LRSAEAKLDAAKTAMEMAKDQLGYAELRANVDGVVTAVSAGPATGRQHAPKAAGATSMYTWANLHIGRQRSKRFCPSAVSGERHPGRLGKQPRVA